MTGPPKLTTTRDAPPANPVGRWIGWALFAALVVAVSIAISLALQLGPEQATPEPPLCGGLYSQCCAEWDDDWGPCRDDDCLDRTRYEDRDEARGLFDAEENFADSRLPPNC